MLRQVDQFRSVIRITRPRIVVQCSKTADFSNNSAMNENHVSIVRGSQKVVFSYGQDSYVFEHPQGWGLCKRVMDKLNGVDTEPMLIFSAEGITHMFAISPGVPISFHLPGDLDSESPVPTVEELEQIYKR